MAISTGPMTHLDHLAPLCCLLKIPLLVTDPEQAEKGKKFYPMIDLRYVPLSDLTLEYIATHCDTILTCGKFWAMELAPLLELFFGKKVRFIFSPHGHSDKEALLNQPVPQEIELVYQVSPEKKKAFVIGNIRYWFYKKHKAHFDALAAPFFVERKKTVLYAPTWATKATPTSFFDHGAKILSTLSTSHHLLVKLHPLLEENNPAAFHQIIGKYEDQAQFILDFPPVYPLLEKTDVYLGDFSSIGYDFLLYDRPMFFLGEGGKLQKCGEPFTGDLNRMQTELSSLRKELYKEVFAECEPKKIKALLLQSLEKD